ncbi:MAG: glutamate-1-semialdehyde 2,1-aminomutase [Leptospiraceae bacterium]|nr:glutamate-1-semialdehyde 2,1-aminomutase [Leptospiraceae bacterium]MDW8305729.1 glutamate-1-semialdehyde 2,1-aminomutase [Leptospiraceae bacterium]
MHKDSSIELFERAQKVSPGGVHSPVRAFRGVGGVPRFIKRSEGPFLYDVDDNRYVDFCLSWGPLLFGHRDPETEEAVRAALSRGWSYGAAEPYSLELCELIQQSIPWAEKIRLVSSGTEAVMSAIRVARAATGRHKILKFDGCYHGHSDSMLVRAGSGLAEASSPDSAGVPPATAQDTLVAPLDDELYIEKLFLTYASQIAAVIIEPLPANYGLLIQRTEFLQKIRDLCTKYHSLLIFDEVISGFRVGFGGMAEKTGIQPDLVTYGKLMGGGFPLAAYAGKKELMDLVAPVGPVYQAGTLSANPVAVAAGLTTLKKLLRDNPYTELTRRTTKFADYLEKHAQEKGIELCVVREASIFWVAFRRDRAIHSIKDIPSGQKERYAKLFHGLLRRGVYLSPSGFEVSFISTAHSDTLLDEVCQKFCEALDEL